MKKGIKQLIGLILVLACILSVAAPANAGTTPYKATSYKSLNEVKKHYVDTSTLMRNPIYYSYQEVKTKYGIRKALFICRGGVTFDQIKTFIYIKNGKKIYKMAAIDGVAQAISSNKKFIYVSGSAVFSAVYKYSSGRYKQYKYTMNDGQEEYDKKRETWKKKYSISSDINYDQTSKYQY